ncbi:MAG: putative Ig domain-containing protein [Gemmatimonadota bacterium]
MEITPAAINMEALGEVILLSARPVPDGAGSAPAIPVVWSSSAPDVVTIDGQGQITARAQGSATITARVAGTLGSASVTVRQVPSSLDVLLGDGQAGTAGRPLPQPLVLLVRDARGNPIPEHAVVFSMESGGGTLAHYSPLTDSGGMVSTIWTLGPQAAESQRVGVRAGPLGLTLSARAISGTAVLLEGDYSGVQVGIRGTVLPEPLAVVATDEFGNGVADVPVVYQPSEGEVNPGETVSDSTGRASAVYRLPDRVGPVHVLALSGDLPSVEFSFMVSGRGSAAHSSATIPNGVLGLPTPVHIELLDQAGLPVVGEGAGLEVRITGGANKGSPVEPVQTDGEGGYATQYIPNLAGVDTISVFLLDEPLKGSPYVSRVAENPITISTSQLPDGRVGVPYGPVRLESSGGSGMVRSWTLVGGLLPSGLSLDSTGVLQGIPSQTGDFPLQLRVDGVEGRADTRALRLRICPAPVELRPGESWSGVPAAPGGCGILLPSGSPGDRYGVALVRATLSVAVADVHQVTLITALADTTPVASPLAAGGSVPRVATPPGLDAFSGTEGFHHGLRMAEMEMVETLLARNGGALRVLPHRPIRGGTDPAVARAEASDVPAPAGNIRRDRRLFDPSLSCFDPSPPRVGLFVEQTEHVAFYQDSIQRDTNPVSAALLREMGAFYESHGREVIRDYFGDAPDVNGDGQVVVFITPTTLPDVAGYVWSGDLVSRSQCPASNEMEIIYFNAHIIQLMSQGNFQALTTLVHEVKHVASFYHRLRRSASRGSVEFHPSWLEEGTAEIAAEMTSRLAWSRAGGPSLATAVEAGHFTEYNPSNYGTMLRLFRMRQHLRSHPNMITGNPVGGHPLHNFYGSSWHFVRWLGDAWNPPSASPTMLAPGEAAFFRAQNDSTGPPGGAGLETLTGRTVEALLDGYATAVMGEESQGVLRSSATPPAGAGFRSYRFRRAMELFPFPAPPGFYPWPVTARPGGSGSVTHADFGTASYSGPMGPSGLRLHEFRSQGSQANGMELWVDSSVPDALLRVVVVRLQ